jgi:ABC-type multidrug transport system permease subunit
MRATPLPTVALLSGRVLGALGVAALTLAGIAALSTAMYRLPLPPAWFAIIVTFVLATVCFAALGLAVATLVHSAQAGVGVALGTLLPLCFISDIFVVGVTFPPVLDAVSWFFPLRHASSAMTEATRPVVEGSGLAWGHLAVLLAWTLAGLVVVVLRFRWESTEPAGRRRRATPPQPEPEARTA